ncbi:MAG TPA: hypothetical protein VFJ70_08125 [Burkholderiales bacterium]|nr:hypothetical protein [Burkholderiales bacterium]
MPSSPRLLPWKRSRSSLELAPEDELPPAAEPCTLLEDEPLCGHWQFRLGELAPLADGDAELLLDGEVPPVALLPDVLPVALPEPDDWLVCAPWFMLEDGFVVVALWFAETLLDVFWSPVPMFTPGLMFAPAFTSVLLMPTLASTPTFGFTFTPPEGDVLLPEPLDCEDCEFWSVVDDDWANAEPKTLITAAAVILTAT